MNEIDRRLFIAFPHCKLPIRLTNWDDDKEDRFKVEGARFLLQMHDELIYEVV